MLVFEKYAGELLVMVSEVAFELFIILLSVGIKFFMLMVYAKNERSDLTKEQLSLLKKIVEREFKNE